MKPNALDIPYGPMAAAARTIIMPSAILMMLGMLGFTIWVHSKNARNEYWIQDFSEKGSSYSVQWPESSEEFVSRGAKGPYKEGPGMTGVVGGGMKFVVKDQSVECPLVPGSYYSGFSYINKDGKAYVVIRRIKETPVAAVMQHSGRQEAEPQRRSNVGDEECFRPLIASEGLELGLELCRVVFEPWKNSMSFIFGVSAFGTFFQCSQSSRHVP